jgi:hypothetical protein
MKANQHLIKLAETVKIAQNGHEAVMFEIALVAK